MGKKAVPPLLLSALFALLSTAAPNNHGTAATMDAALLLPIKQQQQQQQQQQRGTSCTLFVFGDSYADTGNLPIPQSISWKWPYGITFPGKPSGRFSDGRVRTDYIAKFLGIKSPIPYKLIKNFDWNLVRYGINFAHGGTGVFPTMVDYPNMTTQIDFFQQIIHEKVYTSQNLSRSSSVALLSLAGNDYSTYLANNVNPDTMKNLSEFSQLVINQVMTNAKRLHGLGIKKIAITGLHPLGCLPINTASNSYKNCNAAENDFSTFHNQLLVKNIQMLNHNTTSHHDPVFVYIDLYSAFKSILKMQQNPLGDLTRKLKPCCMGEQGEECGGVDNVGKMKFRVCENLNHSLFWDSIHPSNAGWRAVYSFLKHSFSSTLLH